MNYIFDVILIIILFSAFAFSHTIFANNKTKNYLYSFHKDILPFYRLIYNSSSLLTFYLFYTLSPKPDIIIYDLNYPYDIIIFVIQIFSVFGLMWAVRHIDLKEFIGINQILRWHKGNYNYQELDEKSTFITKGAFKYMRHPIYFFSILFLGLRPAMDLFYFSSYILFIIYFYIGAVYEEKKLVEKFGDSYKNYQKNVPRIIPFKIFRTGVNH